MELLATGLLGTLILGFFCASLLPVRLANRYPEKLGGAVIWLAGLTFLASILAGTQIFRSGLMETTVFQYYPVAPVRLGLYVDSLAVVMLGLISFIGLVIARFSLRYLQGDPNQGLFFQRVAFTLGATLLLVVSCNLLMFTLAWMLISLGLHKLLIHYPERSWAVWAARKKFLISRLGDLFLVGALILTYVQFGTLEYKDLFTAQGQITIKENSSAIPTIWIGIFFVLGAITKSAQFPFHTWLPDTMETPTPVSALMHAGIINAGGFLVIRLSPLISHAAPALQLLTLVGAITALYGSLVMMTQTSIKRSLAYSTIAQMGFMMLQCGLGAFSAALLHILAHSAYKAHAFLKCGTLPDRELKPGKTTTVESWASNPWLRATGAGVAIVAIVFLASGVDIFAKPGGLLLALILTVAMIQFLAQGLASKSPWVILSSIFLALASTTVYCLAYKFIDTLVGNNLPSSNNPMTLLEIGLAALFLGGFIGLTVLQALNPLIAKYPAFRAFYVHALNGFYMDIPTRRLTARFYGKPAPIQ